MVVGFDKYKRPCVITELCQQLCEWQQCSQTMRCSLQYAWTILIYSVTTAAAWQPVRAYIVLLGRRRSIRSPRQLEFSLNTRKAPAAMLLQISTSVSPGQQPRHMHCIKVTNLEILQKACDHGTVMSAPCKYKQGVIATCCNASRGIRGCCAEIATRERYKLVPLDQLMCTMNT